MSPATLSDSTATDSPKGNTDHRRLAFEVLDAVDNLQNGLGALRAVGQLAANDDGPGGLVQLQRHDLVALIGVISSNLEAQCVKARAAAALAAQAA